MKDDVLRLLNERVVIFDGAIGTEVMKKGLLEAGRAIEILNLENPEAVEQIHRDYLDCGVDVITTNSFGANRIKLKNFELEQRTVEINYLAASISRRVCPAGKYVAGSIGPTGKFLKPYGDFEESEFESIFAEQASGLAEGGADFILLETQYDLREALCGLRSVKNALGLPVFVSMTFKLTNRGYFTLMGNTPEECCQRLEEYGATAIGANCTLASREMIDLVRILGSKTKLPVVAQPNAGMTCGRETDSPGYEQDIGDYLANMVEIINAGANAVGGCCGIGPEYIKGLYGLIHG